MTASAVHWRARPTVLAGFVWKGSLEVAFSFHRRGRMSPIKKVRPMPAPAAPPAADQRNTVQPPPAQKAEHRGWDPFDKLEDLLADLSKNRRMAQNSTLQESSCRLLER